MELKKIVVATDLSPEAEVAVRQAMRVARHTGAELVLVNVCNIVEPLPPAVAGFAIEQMHALARARFDENRGLLGTLRDRLIGQGVDVSTVLSEGYADAGICAAATELNADLVVTGTHGATGMRRFMLGSVAERVVRLAPCSTLVARADPGGTVGDDGFRNVLVPADFSASSEATLASALAVSAEEASLHLLHAVNRMFPVVGYHGSPLTGAGDLENLHSAIREGAQAECQRLVQRAGEGPGQRNVSFEVTDDAPAVAIQARLDAVRHDLVVMGSHGRRGLRRALLGSTAEVTVRHAPCSVLVVRPKKSEKGN